MAPLSQHGLAAQKTWKARARCRGWLSALAATSYMAAVAAGPVAGKEGVGADLADKAAMCLKAMQEAEEAAATGDAALEALAADTADSSLIAAMHSCLEGLPSRGVTMQRAKAVLGAAGLIGACARVEPGPVALHTRPCP